jgi:UDP-glucose:glycoprotein glucosyltransferase
MNMFWVNGAVVQEKDVHPWGLLRVLRRERGVVGALMGVGAAAEAGKGMTSAQAVDLLTHPNISASQGEKDVLEGLFDASDRSEGGGVIVWWNDLERDSRYARWSGSLYSVSLLVSLLPSPKLTRVFFSFLF